MYKILVAIAAVLVLAGAAWYGGSRYLVSKLDGTGGVTAPQQQDPMVKYTSTELGVSFNYPEQRYTIETHRSGNGEREWHTITLVPSDFVPVEGGEGPPSINITVIPNIEGQGLEQWIHGDARSNFKLSQDDKLTATTLGGHAAFAYRYSGLYENDAVATVTNGNIYLFEAGWLAAGDQGRADFARILESVEF